MAILTAYFVVQSLVAAGFLAADIVSNSTMNLPQLVRSISTNGLVISVSLILSGLVGLGMIIAFIKLRRNITISEYLGLKPLSVKNILVLLAFIFALILVSEIINNVLQVPQDTAFAVETYQTSVWPVLFGIAIVVFAPAFEEAFFRGFLFAGLLPSRLGAIGTIVFTALAWAVLHIQYDYYGMATILVLGVVLGIVRLKTGSLWASFIMHSFWNFLALVATILYVNGIVR